MSHRSQGGDSGQGGTDPKPPPVPPTPPLDHFLLFDLADPPPPQGETYTLDLAAPACAGDVQQVLFLDL